jgi:hypothetical protein
VRTQLEHRHPAPLYVVDELLPLVHGLGLLPRHRSNSRKGGRPCSLGRTVTHVPGLGCHLCT